MTYREFLASKAIADSPSGRPVAVDALNTRLFDFQKIITRWALHRGRAALFADCGLGKTAMQLEWAVNVKGRVLIVAPLAVAQQTIREGEKFGIEVSYAKTQDEAKGAIVITNYERLEGFTARGWAGVVLDESSILKSHDGKTRTAIIDMFSRTPYRLACTATPAPNDYMELGNHAEFLGVMSRAEMLSTFFIHDGGDTSKWRLKGHAQDHFWRWLASWACMVSKPSDLGFSDEGFKLPALNIKTHTLDSETWNKDALFPMPATTLQEQRKVKRNSLEDRVLACAELVSESKARPWIVWCELNDEGDRLQQELAHSVQVAGADSMEDKETRLAAFSRGDTGVLISKGSICGWGMNWQHCNNMAIINLSHSYEQLYQVIRRCWRFGQKKPVNVHLFLMDTELAILQNIQRKQKEADAMADNMARFLNESMRSETGLKRDTLAYKPECKIKLPSFIGD